MACSTVIDPKVTVHQDKTTLSIVLPPPLRLNPVKWKVINVDGKLMYAVDSDGFSNLAKNVEASQNRLWLYLNIIEKYKTYYETKAKQK